MKTSVCFCRAGAAVLTLLVVLALAPVSDAAVVQRFFSLSNHPGGQISPPPYGLRLDGVLTGNRSDQTTFSFSESGDVLLTVTDATSNGGGITIAIEGTVFGGVVQNNAYVDPMFYEVDFLYEVNVAENGGGWKVTGVDNVSNIGTLTKLGSSSPDDLFTLVDDDNNSFLFKPDGHRLAGDSTSWVGRGWLTNNPNGNNQSGIQDWLFVGVEVPEPGSLTLLAAGLVFVGRRSTRRPAD